MTASRWIDLDEAIVAIDLSVVIGIAIWWPPSLPIFAALVIVVVALIDEGAERLFGSRQ